MYTLLPAANVADPTFWLTVVFPVLAALMAVVGVLVAIKALDALKLSRAQLDLQQREADAAEAERNKKPILYLSMNKSMDPNVEVDDEGVLWLGAWIDNLGERAAHNVQIEIDLPLGMREHPYLQLAPDDWYLNFSYSGGAHAILPIEGAVVQKATPKYLGTLALRFTDKDAYQNLPKTVTMPWLITAEEGAWRGACTVNVHSHN